MDFYSSAIELRDFLIDGRAKDVVLLDLREAGIWTDFFIIATVMSSTHANGLQYQLEEKIKELNLEDYYRRRGSEQGSEWKLIDVGGIVVHLMSQMARDFYDLESLHKNAKIV